MAQPHTRSPVVGGKPAWGIAAGTGHLEPDRYPPANGTQRERNCRCILAKVNGVGPQTSLQQEASPGQHAHQRGGQFPTLPILLSSYEYASFDQVPLLCKHLLVCCATRLLDVFL